MARYGKQPLSEILALPRSHFELLRRALCDIVRAENGTGEDDED